MGNIVDQDQKPKTYNFIESLELSFITLSMIQDMLDRWKDLGKPLLMIPKDFRDRILIGVGVNAGGTGGSRHLGAGPGVLSASKPESAMGPSGAISGPSTNILGQMHRQVRLNYMKWLTLGLEIDMFEMFAMLIIFTRSDLSKRLQLIFELFCYNEEEYMQKGEFKFMLNKLCNAIGSTI